jgi:hypothetical protein
MESLDLDPIQILENTFRERISICIYITGRRGTGKTDLALLIAETLIGKDVLEHAATNVRIYPDSPIMLEQINALDDLEYWCQNNTGKKLYVFDEFGKAMRRRTPMSGLNIGLMDNLQILRKYKLSLIIIAPADKYVDMASLGSDVLDITIDKPNPKNQKVALYTDLLDNITFRMLDIPRTHIKFDTWDIAPFKRYGDRQKSHFKEEDKQFLYTYLKKLNTIPWTDKERTRKGRLLDKYGLEWLEKERDM